MPRKSGQIFLRKLCALRDRFDSTGCEHGNLHDAAIIGSTVIDLDNLVVQSFRQFAIQSVRSAQLSNTLGLFSSGLCSDRNYDQELALARWYFTNRRGRRPRPPYNRIAIRKPIDLERNIVTLGCVSPQSLRNAIGIPNQPFDEIKYFRHFYAHRCEDTATQLRSKIPKYLRSRYNHPDEYVKGYDFSSGNRIFDIWWGGVYNFLSVLY